LTCREQIGLRQLGVDGVLGTRVADAESETEQAEEPAYGVLRPAGRHDRAHGREEHGTKRIFKPVVIDVDIRVRKVEDQENEAQRCQRH
jgi:hypothetical protein